MSAEPTGPVTELLDAAARGDAGAHERLWALLYDELHGVAERQMAAERLGRTLQPTALVNEAYLRLIGDGKVQWANRRHFFAAAARAMRRIRIDDARKRNSRKRGGKDASRRRGDESAMDRVEAAFDRDPDEVLAIDEALGKLESKDPRKAEIVMLRYFAGLTVDETAEALGDNTFQTVDSSAWRHPALRTLHLLMGAQIVPALETHANTSL